MFNFLTQKFTNIFSNLTGKNRLSENNLQSVLVQIEEGLLAADAPYLVIKQLINEVKSAVIGQKVFASLNPNEQFIRIFHERLKELLGGSTAFNTFQIPAVIMLMGLQGSGKTTSVAKLIHYVQDLAFKKGKSRSILCASVDFYRPAAVEQLEILVKQVGADFYRARATEPVVAAKEVYQQFQHGRYDYLFLDTAGRLHVDESMLQELHEINLILKPKYKLLVLDGMTGQESLKVAQAFDNKIDFSGAILSKMDSGALGGSALAFRYVLKKPIYFIGTGEKVEDLEQFHPERMASRLVGMGDLQTLFEQAESKVKLEEQKKSLDSLKRGQFTLEDFAQQLEMVSKMGSLSKLVSYLPGVGAKVTPEMVEQGERELRKFRAIMSSMTHRERLAPQILNQSRKLRIACGAGVNVTEVNCLLQKFEQSAQFVKLFKRRGQFGGLF